MAKLLRVYHNGNVGRRKGDLKDVTSFTARWTEQAWRIAVAFHAALHGEKAHEHTLPIEAVRVAITIASRSRKHGANGRGARSTWSDNKQKGVPLFNGTPSLPSAPESFRGLYKVNNYGTNTRTR